MKITKYASLGLIFLMALALAGCSAAVSDEIKSPVYQLKDWSSSAPPKNPSIDPNQPVVFLTISGGGFRSAAFALGAMRALHDLELPEGLKPSIIGRRSILKGVDYISSVSGGSIVAGYYAANMPVDPKEYDNYFEEFRTRFHNILLKTQIQSELQERFYSEGINLVFNLLWQRRLPPGILRHRHLIDAFQKDIFGDKTLKDLLVKDSLDMKSPRLLINATNLNIQAPFTFTLANFRCLGLDFHEFPLAAAVAASGAVPGIFEPLDLENNHNPTISELPRSAKENPWLHCSEFLKNKKSNAKLFLADGGVSDNLAIEGAIAEFNRLKALHPELKAFFITLDARSASGFSGTRDKKPDIGDVVLQSFDTLMNKKSDFNRIFYSKIINAYGVELIVIDFSGFLTQDRLQNNPVYRTDPNAIDSTLHKDLVSVETSYQLKDYEVDTLVRAGYDLVMEKQSEIKDRLLCLANRNFDKEHFDKIDRRAMKNPGMSDKGQALKGLAGCGEPDSAKKLGLERIPKKEGDEIPLLWRWPLDLSNDLHVFERSLLTLLELWVNDFRELRRIREIRETNARIAAQEEILKKEAEIREKLKTEEGAKKKLLESLKDQDKKLEETRKEFSTARSKLEGARAAEQKRLQEEIARSLGKINSLQQEKETLQKQDLDKAGEIQKLVEQLNSLKAELKVEKERLEKREPIQTK